MELFSRSWPGLTGLNKAGNDSQGYKCPSESSGRLSPMDLLGKAASRSAGKAGTRSCLPAPAPIPNPANPKRLGPVGWGASLLFAGCARNLGIESLRPAPWMVRWALLGVHLSPSLSSKFPVGIGAPRPGWKLSSIPGVLLGNNRELLNPGVLGGGSWFHFFPVCFLLGNPRTFQFSATDH